ncbi:MAG: manganese efflux pump MntP family protein [bacterium]
MTLLEITGVAIGLAMDASAVSIANGISIKNIKQKDALKIAFSFGFFQAIMPLIGWALGLSFRTYIQSFDHWIAFGLLFIIGAHMLIEAFQKNDPDCSKKNCLNPKTLLIMSIATSIDALAAGISFSVLKMDIWFPIAIIGSITFILSYIFLMSGNKLGNRFGKGMDFVGGAILIAIGIKILVQHFINKI